MRTTITTICIALISCTSCKAPEQKTPEAPAQVIDEGNTSEYVLAQWTFNKALFAGDMNTVDFVNTAADLGFAGVEFVNQFFRNEIDNAEYFSKLKAALDARKIKGTLLMVDLKDNQLGDEDQASREKAIELHKKWMTAASSLGCANIRVNAFGQGEPADVMDRCYTGIVELLNYGKKIGVGVIVENHGRYSSNADWLVELVSKLVPHGGGSLADFDNWCMERENGKRWGAPCIKEYDRYEGMQKVLPTAKSVSLKAFDFDKDGNAVKTDFGKMYDLIKASQYDEYLAVEFEGHDMDPLEGIRKTLELCKRYDVNAPDPTPGK